MVPVSWEEGLRLEEGEKENPSLSNEGEGKKEVFFPLGKGRGKKGRKKNEGGIFGKSCFAHIEKKGPFCRHVGGGGPNFVMSHEKGRRGKCNENQKGGTVLLNLQSSKGNQLCFPPTREKEKKKESSAISRGGGGKGGDKDIQNLEGGKELSYASLSHI